MKKQNNELTPNLLRKNYLKKGWIQGREIIILFHFLSAILPNTPLTSYRSLGRENCTHSTKTISAFRSPPRLRVVVEIVGLKITNVFERKG